jgi:glycine/D-amino acid oxidase-like deaminating enzyme
VTSFGDITEVCRIFGEKAGRLFTKFLSEGVSILKELSGNSPEILKNSGSLYCVDRTDFRDAVFEIGIAKKAGIECYKYDLKDLESLYGSNSYYRVFYIPCDCVVDPIKYLYRLISQQQLEVITDTRVIGLKKKKNAIEVYTDKRENVAARKVVIATNGFPFDLNIRKWVKPIWSFLSGFEWDAPDAPNGWTSNEYFNYWVRQNGVFIVGGEETAMDIENFRFSSKEQTAFDELTSFTYRNFPFLKDKLPIFQHFGIFGETKDAIPIIGQYDEENIYYLVGCNGEGMAGFAKGAELLVKIMGYKEMSGYDRQYKEIMSPLRETL